MQNKWNDIDYQNELNKSIIRWHINNRKAGSLQSDLRVIQKFLYSGRRTDFIFPV